MNAAEIAAPMNETAAPTPAAAASHATSEIDAITADLLAGKLNPDAVPAAEGEEPGEVAAKPKEAAKEEKFDAAVNAAKKARSAAARNRELSAQGEKQQQAIHARDQEIARVRQQSAADRAEIQRLNAWEQGLKADPYAALQERGMTPEQLTQRILKDGSPESMLEKMEARLAAESDARVALEQRLEQRDRQAARSRVESNFFAEAAKADAYPHLSEVPQRFILPAVNQLQADLLAEGYSQGEVSALTHDQVCTLLEREYAAVRKARPAPSAAAPAAKQPAQTLTAKLGSTRLSAPANYDELPVEEQTKHLNKLAKSLGIGRAPEE